MSSSIHIACDTHVHCYDFENLPLLLDSAVKNLRHFVSNADAQLLFFTDGYVDRTWLKLQELLKSTAKAGDWSFAYNDSTQFIEALKDDGEYKMLLAPARQVNTAGRLEMLLLGCDEELEDKQPANELIDKYGEKYVLVSPWGVGKWLGKRGRVLVDIINHSQKPFALGDNGGRPFFWPVPHFRFLRQFQSSKNGQNPLKRHLPILNGSDPLPIRGEISRTASYGVIFDLLETKEISLKNILLAMKSDQTQFENYGQLMGVFPFVLGRIKMLLR